ncbi:MAG: FliH/SctL family protein [Acidobacteriaceae bacterium]|nr:FliH/SctL family protein [Acidobacteriaceae bacterium]
MNVETVKSVELFQYAESDALGLPEWDGFGSAESSPHREASNNEAALRQQLELETAEQVRHGFEAGRQQGVQEGRQAEREALAGARAADDRRRAEQVAELVQRFAEDRERYLQSIEHEVVSLALAVAARILRREAQMDPLLLTGAVRVALGQLSNSTAVKLLVPAAELDLWRESIAHLPNLTVKPVVEAGEGMRMGDCMIETTVGTVDLGIRSQLSEIERGFFDRAGQRSVSAGATGKTSGEQTA